MAHWIWSVVEGNCRTVAVAATGAGSMAVWVLLHRHPLQRQTAAWDSWQTRVCTWSWSWEHVTSRRPGGARWEWWRFAANCAKMLSRLTQLFFSVWDRFRAGERISACGLAAAKCWRHGLRWNVTFAFSIWGELFCAGRSVQSTSYI